MKILVIRLSSLGDLFHALPAVHAVKQGLKAEIHWVTNKEYVDLVRHFVDVARVISFPRRSLLADGRYFLRELRRESYDVVMDMQGLFKSALVGRLAHANRRIGPSYEREGARLLYDAVAGVKNKDRHAVEENLDMVRFLGLPVLPPEFPVYCQVPDLPGGRPRVAMVALSRWPTKNWPSDCFAAVGRRLQETLGASLVLVGGRDSAMVHEQIQTGLIRPALDMAGRCTLSETLGVLKGVDLLIANDTGPIHMAAAVGTPVLAVFGPTDPKRTGPYGGGHRILRSELPCQPCFSRSCRRSGVPCLAGVTPERVAEVAIDMLSRLQSGGSSSRVSDPGDLP